MKKDILPNTKKTIFVLIGFLIIVVSTCLILTGVFDKDRSPSESTESPITPIPIQLSGWEDLTINTLCLDISQEYPEEWFFFFKETLVKLGMDITPKQYSFPYDTVIGEIMQSIGVQVAEKGAQCSVKTDPSRNAGEEHKEKEIEDVTAKIYCHVKSVTSYFT